MKSVVTLLIIAVLLLGIGGYCHLDLNSRAQALEALCDTAIDDGTQLSAVKAQWETCKTRWHLYIDHRDLRDIDLWLNQAEEAWMVKDALEYRRWLVCLHTLFEDLPLRERLMWINVF